MQKQDVIETKKPAFVKATAGRQENKKTDFKKSKGPWVLVGLLSCLVIVLVVGIVIYMIYRVAKKSVVEEMTKPTNVYHQVPTNTNESATLPAYATYTNYRYGFSFYYPILWWHQESENSDGVTMSPDVDSLEEANSKEDIFSVVAYGWKNIGGQSLNEFLAENEGGNNQVLADYKIEKKEDVKLGGLEAKKLTESFRVMNTEVRMKRIAIYHLDSKGGLGLIITCLEDSWQKNSATIEKVVESYKLDKTVYDKEVGFSGSDLPIGTSDPDQIIRAVDAAVRTNGAVTEFSISIDRQTDEWARCTVTPDNPQEADPLIVLLKKVNGEWQVMDMGTDLSQWYDQTPGGFWN